MKANKAIWLLSAAALALSILLRSQALSWVLIALCALSALVILYRHLPELSNLSPDNPKARLLRRITVVNAALVAAFAALALLMETGVIALSEQAAALVPPCLFAALIIGFGNVAPKIPFNRYTGLRLPWTVSDEETWIIAHRLLGYLSLPCGLLCFAGVANAQNPAHIPVAMLLVWIAIPSILSGLFFRRKFS